MLYITVAQTTVRELKGLAKLSGKPYHLRFQAAYAYTVDSAGNRPPFPEKFEVMLDSDQAPYPVGDYVLADHSIYLDRDCKLAIAPKLVARKA